MFVLVIEEDGFWFVRRGRVGLGMVLFLRI